MLHTLLLAVHVVAGTAGLLLAGPVLLLPKRPGWHVRLGRAYVVALAAMCLTALALFAADPAALAGLGVLGAGTLLAGGIGWWAAARKPGLPGGWVVWHLNAMGSSAIAFVTAFVVQVTDGHPAAWVLPTVIGSPLIARRTARIRRDGGRLAPRRVPAPRVTV